MRTFVKTLVAPEMKHRLEAAGIKQQAVADRYGCFRQFVTSVLARRAPCPKRLRQLMEEMLEDAGR